MTAPSLPVLVPVPVAGDRFAAALAGPEDLVSVPLVAASDVLGWGSTAFALGSTVIGLFIGYKAYQGYRRHESRSMQYLSIGLFMLTAVAYAVAFVGSALLRLDVLADRYEVLITIVARMFQFAGLAFIAYSLNSRRDR